MRPAQTICGIAILALVLSTPARVCPQADEHVYYSIHLASFSSLENTNAALNALKHPGKAVFWKRVRIPEQGTVYRVYLGRYPSREEAVAYWEQLKSEGAVSYFGVHKFTEAVEPVTLADLPETLSDPVPELPGAPRKDAAGPSPASLADRFEDNGDGTVTDRETRLMWVKNGWRLDFLSAVDWEEAVSKAGAFRHGGHADWRLPTIEEWMTLIDRNRQYPALVEPNPFENVIVHMPYWTGSEYNPRAMQHTRAFTVLLYSGNVHHQAKTEKAFVLPVRSLK